METAVRGLFARYESFFNRSLGDSMDMDELGSFYTPEFIGAAPAGVRTAKNDDEFRQVMAQVYGHYREIGTREMRIRNLRLSPIDELHCLAHVDWAATYDRKDQPDVVLEFTVHYLVQTMNAEPQIFGWISGDEQALLKKHGIA